MVKLR